MKGEAEHDFHGERSENEIEFSPFARQLTITKTKKLIRRHTKKLNKSKVHKNSGELLYAMHQKRIFHWLFHYGTCLDI